MTSANASVRTGFESDEHGTTPALNGAYSEKTRFDIRQSALDLARGQARQKRTANSQRFDHFIEPDRNPRGHIPGCLRRRFDLQVVVRGPWKICPQIVGNARGASNQTGGIETVRSFVRQDSGLTETVLNSRM